MGNASRRLFLCGTDGDCIGCSTSGCLLNALDLADPDGKYPVEQDSSDEWSQRTNCTSLLHHNRKLIQEEKRLYNGEISQMCISYEIKPKSKSKNANTYASLSYENNNGFRDMDTNASVVSEITEVEIKTNTENIEAKTKSTPKNSLSRVLSISLLPSYQNANSDDDTEPTSNLSPKACFASFEDGKLPHAMLLSLLLFLCGSLLSFLIHKYYPRENEVNSYLKFSWMEPLSSSIFYTFVLSWCIAPFFQMFLNYKQKSTVGLSIDAYILSLMGFVCYAIYNFSIYSSSNLNTLYRKRHNGQHIEVDENDMVFSFYAVVMSLLIILQIIYYEYVLDSGTAHYKIRRRRRRRRRRGRSRDRSKTFSYSNGLFDENGENGFKTSQNKPRSLSRHNHKNHHRRAQSLDFEPDIAHPTKSKKRLNYQRSYRRYQDMMEKRYLRPAFQRQVSQTGVIPMTSTLIFICVMVIALSVYALVILFYPTFPHAINCRIFANNGNVTHINGTDINSTIPSMTVTTTTTATLTAIKSSGGIKYFNWLYFCYTLSIFKVLAVTIRHIPQIFLNHQRQSTKGYSIYNVICDFYGGILLITHLILDCWNTNNWGGIIDNISMLMLGCASVLFNLIYMVQHYYLYNDKWGQYVTLDDAASETEVSPVRRVLV